MAFRAEDGRNGASVAGADDDDALTLAGLIDGKTTITAVFAVISPSYSSHRRAIVIFSAT